jgi:hypothetical protein
VIVASSGGSADVRNSSGVLTAHLLAGMSLAFDPQVAAPSAVHISGILEAHNGNFFITDATTKVTVQVEGANAAKYVGKNVQVTGSSTGAAPAGGASQVVHLTSISTLSTGAAGGTAGAAAAGTGASTGLSGVAIGAIVGGVAVSGVVGGLAASGSFSSNDAVSRQ